MWPNIPNIWGSTTKALVSIDVFSKHDFVEPVNGATVADALEGMRQGIFVRGPPKEAYTDDGGEFKADFVHHI